MVDSLMKMLRLLVDSRAIRSIGYDKAGLILEVEFIDGNVYQYVAVPVSVYEELRAARSIGGFFNSRIIGTYRQARVES